MSKSGKERLYADLKRKILTLALEPGAHLDETTLSVDYGISTITDRKQTIARRRRSNPRDRQPVDCRGAWGPRNHGRS